MSKFKPGDIVYHVNTKKCYKFERYNYAYYAYLKTTNGRSTEVDSSKLRLATDEQKYELWFLKTEEGKKAMQNILYEVTKEDNSIVFANFLTKNSAGLWVMQMAGSGDVFLAKESSCKEVVQYTIKVKFMFGGNTSEFVAKEGQFKAGDTFVTQGGDFAVVVGLDTKNRTVSKEFKPTRRVVLEDV